MKILKSILGVGTVIVLLLSFTFVFAKGPQAIVNQKALNNASSAQQQNEGCGFSSGMHTNLQEYAAKALGITVDELAQKIQNGQTINEILKEKQLTIDEFKKRLYELRIAEIDKLLKDGIITKEQADLVKQHIQTHIQNCIDNLANWSNNGSGYGGMMGFGHGGMMNFGHGNMMGTDSEGMMGY